MTRRLFLILLLLTALLGVYIGHIFTDGATDSSAPTVRFSLSSYGDYRDLNPCSAEDSPGPCYWDAGTRGNGRGDSFWVDARQRVHYIDVFSDFGYRWQPMNPWLEKLLTKSHPRVWSDCAVRVPLADAGRTTVICPDGLTMRFRDEWHR